MSVSTEKADNVAHVTVLNERNPNVKIGSLNYLLYNQIIVYKEKEHFKLAGVAKILSVSLHYGSKKVINYWTGRSLFKQHDSNLNLINLHKPT